MSLKQTAQYSTLMRLLSQRTDGRRGGMAQMYVTILSLALSLQSASHRQQKEGWRERERVEQDLIKQKSEMWKTHEFDKA